MDRVFQDLRIAIRALRRHRSFTLVAVLTLALGIGATTALFSVVYGVLLKPLPYVAAEQLMAIGQVTKGGTQVAVDGSVSHLNYLDWKRETRTLQSMALWSRSRVVVTNVGDADVFDAAAVTPDFFRVFEAPPILGRTFTAEEDRPQGPPAIVVSHGFWQTRLGGRTDVLSQAVEIGGRMRPIVGVAPPGFAFPPGASVWLPLASDDQRCGRDCVYSNVIARAGEGTTVDAARAEMIAIAASLEAEYPAANTGVTVEVTSLRDRTVGDVRLALTILLGAVIMVLLIACANVANLVLVRGTARHGELAVRSALGAGRRGLVSYLLAENLVLAIAGGAAGLVLAAWGVDTLKWLAPANLPRIDEVAFDRPAFLFSLGLVGLTTLLFGLGPSIRLSRVPPMRALGQRGAIDGSGGAARAGLLAAEIGLALVLLLGAGLMLRSLAAQQRIDPGWRSDGITTFLVSLPAARYPADRVVDTFDRLDAELAGVPGVESVGRISGLPLGTSENVLDFTRTDRPIPEPGQVPSALYRVVDPDYFRLLGIAIQAGRAFEPGDRASGPRVAIISRALAETYFAGEDPIGRTIRMGAPDPIEIVGVAANVRSQQLQSDAAPEMYVPHAQAGSRAMTFVVKSNRPAAQVLDDAREVVRRLDTRVPLLFAGPFRALEDAALARPRFYLWLLGLFAALAVTLAAVGIYGVVAYAVTRRTREIGVRLALGASRRQVVALMLWYGLRPSIVGVAAGLAAAVAGGRLIEGLLYEVPPSDPFTFVSVTLGLVAVAGLASVLPAARASRVAPAEALRTE